MGKHFSVEFRKTCKICQAVLPKGYRSYCSKDCRTRFFNKKHYPSQIEWARRKRGEYRQGKLRCAICAKWYVQIISHVIQYHKITGAEYREEFDLPMRGIIPKWYKELKGELALDNGTYKNLRKGILKRYSKDDPKAKIVTGWKGRTGKIGYTPTDYAE